jgi:1-acyl-sn-glycerol-3-phosphate acyltransferase
LPAPRLGLLSRFVRAAMIGWYRRNGWAPEGSLPAARKFVLAGAQHTSNWDFLVFVGTIDALGRRVRFMGKHTLFRWPLTSLMCGLGGVPVDRGARKDMVAQMVDQFAAHDDFILVVAPEGTRSKTDRWRTGFYRIALDAGVPIVCAAPDYARRRGVIGPTIVPTGDFQRDMAPAFDFFRSATPRHPERGFVP